MKSFLSTKEELTNIVQSLRNKRGGGDSTVAEL